MPTQSTLRRRASDIPWAALLRGAVILSRRWAALSAKERARLAELVRLSRGRVSNLTVKQRLELRKLVQKLDLKGAGRELVVLRGTRRRRLSRRRG